MPKFHLALPDGGEAIHELVDATITVGRLVENGMQIEDASISSHHARLSLGEDGNYILTDLGSTNGTLYNGEELGEGEDRLLRSGDRVRFGHVESVYVVESAEEAQEMPEAEEMGAEVAEESIRPSDFGNASPFQIKQIKKDSLGLGILCLAFFAIVVFAVAIWKVTTIQVPN